MKATNIETLKWTDDQLVLLDQTRLPEQEAYLGIQSLEELIVAIQSLCVRGAPAIGISAAYGMVLAARSITSIQPKTLYMDRLRHLAKQLMAARPTALICNGLSSGSSQISSVSPNCRSRTFPIIFSPRHAIFIRMTVTAATRWHAMGKPFFQRRLAS